MVFPGAAMSDPLAESTKSFARVRDLLLGASQDAGSQANWARARKLLELAERVDRLRAELETMAKDTTAEEEPAQPQLSASLEDSKPSQERVSQAGYPKYLVRDGVLVKRGLQRSGVDVYEHAVPQDHYERILAQLGNMAAAVRTHGRQRPFTIEQLQGEVEGPRYMTYVVVSLLLREGLLIRARKGKYTFTAPATFAVDAANLWDRLKGEDPT
jgi:hypothetical protein